VANSPDNLIRPAHPADLPAILAIEQVAFNGDRFNRRQFRYLMLRAQARFDVLESAGRVCAYSILFTPKLLRRARLYSIAVHPSAQGRGYGMLLLQRCIDLARASGFSHLTLEVRSDNRPAITLYERLGFVFSGSRAGYYEDGCEARSYLLNLQLPTNS
jgi:[ribosomal protein S18]-alanine N-acetyltransferase